MIIRFYSLHKLCGSLRLRTEVLRHTGVSSCPCRQAGLWLKYRLYGTADLIVLSSLKSLSIDMAF